MLQMTQLLGQMQRSQQEFELDHRNNRNGGNARVTIRDFLALNPPTFQPTEEPLDADDWLREVNHVLTVGSVAEVDKVSFATHLLKGESAAWWENLQEMRGHDDRITWAEFRLAFKRHHVPEGLMERKKEQFCNLVQGSKTILGYSREFSFLARYGGEEASTDAKKQKRFRNGLNPAMKYALTHVKTSSLEELVNTAIQEETGRHAYESSRKHNQDDGLPPRSATAQKRRMWVPNPDPQGPAYVHRPAGYTPRPLAPQSTQRYYQTSPRPSYGGPPRPAFGAPPRPQVGSRPSVTCHKCGQLGHISTYCPQS